MFWFWKQQDAFDEFVWRETVAKENEHGCRWRTTSSWAASIKAQTYCETGKPKLQVLVVLQRQFRQVGPLISWYLACIPLFDLNVHVLAIISILFLLCKVCSHINVKDVMIFFDLIIMIISCDTKGTVEFLISYSNKERGDCLCLMLMLRWINWLKNSGEIRGKMR